MHQETCAERAAEAVRAQTGRDLIAEIGGAPRTWRDAAALYRRFGVRSLAELTTKLLGEPISRKQARRGDPVMMRGALGICRGEVAEFIDATWPTRMVDLAWRADGRPAHAGAAES